MQGTTIAVMIQPSARNVPMSPARNSPPPKSTFTPKHKSHSKKPFARNVANATIWVAKNQTPEKKGVHLPDLVQHLDKCLQNGLEKLSDQSKMVSSDDFVPLRWSTISWGGNAFMYSN